MLLVEESGIALVALSAVPSTTTSSAEESVLLTDKFRRAVDREGLSLVFFVADGG